MKIDRVPMKKIKKTNRETSRTRTILKLKFYHRYLYIFRRVTIFYYDYYHFLIRASAFREFAALV